MKEITEEKTHYQCEICGQVYDTKSEAIECEKVPITKKKKVKVGDIVIICRHNSCINGSFVKVKEIKVANRELAMSLGVAYKNYHHTIYIKAIYSKGLHGRDDKIITALYDEYKV